MKQTLIRVDAILESHLFHELPDPTRQWDRISVECDSSSFYFKKLDTRPPCKIHQDGSTLFLCLGSSMIIYTSTDTFLDNFTQLLFIHGNSNECFDLKTADGKQCMHFTRYTKMIIGKQYQLSMNDPGVLAHITFRANNKIKFERGLRDTGSVKWDTYYSNCLETLIDILPHFCSDLGGNSRLTMREHSSHCVLSCAAPKLEFTIFKIGRPLDDPY